LISEPQKGSPADKAGLKSGDVVVALNDQPVKSARDLARQVAAAGVGKDVKLAVIRDGKTMDVNVKLAQMQERPARQASANSSQPKPMEHLGIAVAPSADVEGAGKDGLAVLEVSPSGSAAESGIEAGDIILKAGTSKVASASDLETALKQAKSAGRSKVLLLVKHENNERFITVPAAG
ncbi:MAG: PDZ domain-containing protein, partial [Proteobacteria bacterium]|nr:PDZ domain-containing protein [Pseudomonadota bacterium]